MVPAFKTTLPPIYADLIKELRENQVNIVVKDNSRNSWLTILLNWFPILLLIFFWFIFMRQMQSGGNKSYVPFGKSRFSNLSHQRRKESLSRMWLAWTKPSKNFRK